MKFRRRHADDVSVNLTPLIDIVFLMLIFFMVSTTFTRESHLTIDLPESKTEAGEQSEVRMIEVIIDGKGGYAVNDRRLVNNTMSILRKAVSEVAEGDTGIAFVITADAQAPHEAVVRAMDVAGQLGFAHLRITTQKTD